MRNKETGVPIPAIVKGRVLEDVLEKYMEFYDNAERISAVVGGDEETQIGNKLAAAIYRTYLLGVEDGMKEDE